MAVRYLEAYPQDVAVAPSDLPYYEDDMITIADRVVRIGGTTYAMAHIASVKVVRVRTSRLGLALLGAMLFGLLGVVGALLVMPLSAYGQVTLALIASLGGMAGFVTGLVSQKARHAVQIRLLSGDTGAVVSHDRGYVQGLEDMLVRALADFYALGPSSD